MSTVTYPVFGTLFFRKGFGGAVTLPICPGQRPRRSQGGETPGSTAELIL